jgi:hypothetical protein
MLRRWPLSRRWPSGPVGLTIGRKVFVGPAGWKQIVPALLPAERGVHKVLQGCSMEQAIQRPLVRRVTDDDDFTAVPCRGKVTEEVARLVHDLAVTLPVRVGLVDVPASFSGEQGYGACR